MELKTCKFESISKVNFDTIIDVRSPKEFTEDHIPNSINLPVLSDFEREVVGKIYIQNSQFEAKKIAGITSEVLVLGAISGKDVNLLSPDAKLENGTLIV